MQTIFYILSEKSRIFFSGKEVEHPPPPIRIRFPSYIIEFFFDALPSTNKYILDENSTSLEMWVLKLGVNAR